jgi:hypothetical protein
MGYVHDTAMSLFIPPTAFGFSAGTWTLTVATNVWSMDRTAADASNTIYMPIPIPSNSVALKGAKLLSVEFMYSISTAAADDFAVATCLIYTDTLSASAASGSGTINTAAALTSTKDTGHDTDAECLAQDEHRMVLTVTTPVWTDNDVAYHAEFIVDGGAATVVKVFGGIANYTLRV